ncbi:DENN domain-containing protein 2A-like isoform X2 [Liolophura sinensis]|uniref:DENN domain-containing protein 2A-like isoform X2 n=1 Tax=Liolophura sinensis TaxID=3198878 RepID=UPI003159912A
MENGNTNSVRNLPPGRLNNIRQQFEKKSNNGHVGPALPTKTSRAPKIPVSRGEGAKSPNATTDFNQENKLVQEYGVDRSTPPIPPKQMAIPPIPPKENSTASKIQLFSPPGNNLPQCNRGVTPASRNSPVGGSVLPIPISPKTVMAEATGSKGDHHDVRQPKALGQEDISKMYAVVNKTKNGETSTEKAASGASAPHTAKLFEGNSQQTNITPKKQKPPLTDKPRLSKKPTFSDSESSPKKTGVRQRSPKRPAPVPVKASLSSPGLNSTKTSPDQALRDGEKSIQERDERTSAPPRPPQKPPRTHAHDKYLDPKIANLKIRISPRQSIHSNSSSSKQDVAVANTTKTSLHHSKDHRNQAYSQMDIDFSDTSLGDEINRRPSRPKRPPPPRPKSSPSFSSVKGFSYQEDVSTGQKKKERRSPVFDKHGKVQQPEMVRNIMYEPSADFLPLPVLKPSPRPMPVTSPPGVHNALHNEIKMGLLPPFFKSPPTVDRGMFRSCSDECLYMEPSLSGDPVYMDPMESCRVTALDDTYASHDVEVYIDADGYAVPHRFKKQGGPQSPGPGMKDKFRGFFQMFSDPPQDQDTPRNQKKRIAAGVVRKSWDVKQKVNQAFSLLQKIVKKRESFGETVKENPDRQSIDSDSFVDVSEIMRRVEYVQSVKVKTYTSVRNVRKFMDKIYPQLYECAIIVELHRKQVDGRLVNQPEIKHKFPEIVNIAETIPLFCFPDAEHINIRLLQPKKSESYSFVLTDADGSHVFGYCRRYTVVEEGMKKVEVICILSPVSAFQMYSQLLDSLESCRKISLYSAQELIASSFGRPLPNPGKTVQIRTMTEEGEVESLILNRAFDNRLENVNYECLLSVLGVDKLVKVFASVLLERRLLFYASNLSVLSSTIQALTALLYPFIWHHTFIPVLPPALLDIVCAPTPYIIGALSSEMVKVDTLPVDEALIIDLDSKCLLKVFGDESTILPKKVHKALKTALNLCRIESDKRSQNLMMSEAFIRLFVELIGHFGEYIHTQPDGKKVFKKDEFINGASSDGICQLLQWFTDTQMFEVFITDQLEKDHHRTAELFLTRIVEYRESGTAPASIKLNVKEFGRKVKNFGKAIKTKLT